MPTLTQYRTSTQRLLGTGSQQNLYSDTDLNAFINSARGQVALEGQCIRRLPPISGPISTITVTSGGTGFNGAASIVIAAPDLPSGQPPTPSGVQASATATASAAILTITVQSGGDGYFAPVISTSGAGQGAVLTATISGINTTVANQEVYRYSDVNSMVAVSGSGIASIFMVNSISVLYANSRYTLNHCGWSKFQALARNVVQSFRGPPAAFAQFGQGNSGSVYVQPVPDSAYAWEWDVCCVPSDMATDSDPEPIPFPWTEAVQYYAAYLAFSQAQRFADADRMFKEYTSYMHRSRSMSQPRSVSSWYTR